ncbi:32564_t:CDS:10 [Gigaspora margarita]|uniref:32564_t:CDS:1 n=1 Tax=Gigaspora margarita TaxID=4874 RepID=A0ABM8VWM5_GIGMA|nr:32564_t:CDS:10 [Gigaspora margarita]
MSSIEKNVEIKVETMENGILSFFKKNEKESSVSNDQEIIDIDEEKLQSLIVLKVEKKNSGNKIVPFITRIAKSVINGEKNGKKFSKGEKPTSREGEFFPRISEDFSPDFKFPEVSNKKRLFGYIGNSLNVELLKSFFRENEEIFSSVLTRDRKLKNDFKFVDLFSGIGGFHQAIKQTFPKSECVAAVEKDDFCKETYLLNYESKNFYSDITNEKETQIHLVNSNIEYDLVTAGFPCTPFSKAGKMLGVNHPEGKLFDSVVKIIRDYNNNHEEYEFSGFIAILAEAGNKFSETYKNQNRIKSFDEELREKIIKELEEISKPFKKISQKHRKLNLLNKSGYFLALDIDAKKFANSDFFPPPSKEINKTLFPDSDLSADFPLLAKYRQISENEDKIKDAEYFLRQLRKVYNEEIGTDNSKILFENSKTILRKLVEEDKKVGTIFGKIQSGKTYNYISLFVNAFTNYDFDICVIINGNNDDLYQQNKEVIERKINSIGAAENYQILEAKRDQGLDFQSLFVHAKRKKSKFIIFTLKHRSQLEKVTKLFSSQKLSVKVLIIDDEGDQASLNIKKIKKALGDYYSSNNRSVTNKSIINLKNSCDSFFLSVTATPYANLLIRKEDDLSPDFIEMIPTGRPNNNKKYVGINDVFVDLREKLVKEEEVNLLDSNAEAKTIPPSLKIAISTFLLGSVITEKDSLEMYEKLISVTRLWLSQEVENDYQEIKEMEEIFRQDLTDHTQYIPEKNYKEEWFFWEKSKNEFKDASGSYHGRKHKEKEFNDFSEFVKYLGGEKVLNMMLNKCEEKAKLKKATPKIVLMRPSVDSKRTFIRSKSNNKLTINPFVGRDPSKKEDEDKYLGDENL